MEKRHLGGYIRQARERLGLTQEELAERVGKDQRAISEYEHGKRRLSAVDLPAFARALNVSLLDFFGGAVTPNDYDAALLIQFNRLPGDEAKRAVIEMVRLFSDTLEHHTSSPLR